MADIPVLIKEVTPETKAIIVCVAQGHEFDEDDMQEWMERVKKATGVDVFLVWGVTIHLVTKSNKADVDESMEEGIDG